MKKLVVTVVFALGVFILQMPQAAAEDYPVGEEWEGGWKAYIVVESVDWQVKSPVEIIFYCRLKGVSPQGKVKYFDYVFTPINDNNNKMIGASFRDSTGATGRFYKNNPGVYRVEYKVFQMLLEAFSETLNQAG
mgnify:CR=1 FL=1